MAASLPPTVGSIGYLCELTKSVCVFVYLFILFVVSLFIPFVAGLFIPFVVGLFIPFVVSLSNHELVNKLIALVILPSTSSLRQAQGERSL
ncbi:MAG: hypothetical protein ACRCRW_15015 [Aeromonadaceae bacterium]